MDNGCPKCEKIARDSFLGDYGFTDELCIDCRLEQAEHDVLKAMNRVEELKRKKEKQNELSDSKTV